jgi:translation initiation factor 4E
MAAEKEAMSEGQGDPKASVTGNKAAEGKEEAAAPETPEVAVVKHPLQSEWQLWYWKPEKGREWIDNLLSVTHFSTVEDFWALYNHIELASNLQMGSDYCIFKAGIKPMWEDERNKRGGRWLFTLNKKGTAAKTVDEMWLETLLCLIGEAFGEESEQICGAVINVRPKMDKISIWTSDKSSAAVLKIGKILKQRTGYGATAQYEAHTDTQTKQGTSARHLYQC